MEVKKKATKNDSRCLIENPHPKKLSDRTKFLEDFCFVREEPKFFFRYEKKEATRGGQSVNLFAQTNDPTSSV